MKKYLLLSVSLMLVFGLSSCSFGSNKTQETGEEIGQIRSETVGENRETLGSLNSKQEKVEEINKEPLAEYLQYTGDGDTLKFENILSDNSFYTRYQISYTSEGFKISGIMNIPKGEGVFPLIILNHGYIDPTIYTLGRGLKREQDYFARNGFAVLHTDYRNHALSDDDNSLQGTGSILRSKKYGTDTINAILAVQKAKTEGMAELQNINSEKVGMLGHSMGGGVTLYALVAAPDLIDAAVLYAPVHSNEYYNYQKWGKNRLSTEEKEILENIYGDLEKPESFINISPENYFQNIEAPVQMYFGTLDESCPIAWGDDIQQAFDTAGKELEYIKYEGEKHEFIPRWNDFMQGSSIFFKESFQ